ncbi:MAG TPA: ABC transporter substrate-binding protein [Firmicutes bacterium]|nr:ABC transporter substrate-binding protein [Bacillota bacterium]
MLHRKRLMGVVAFLILGLCLSSVTYGAPPIKIGIVAPLSGGAAMVGDTQVKGIALAIKQINAQGGIHGRQVVYYAEDDEQIPAKSVNAVNKLVYQQKVDAVIGTVNSSCTLANMEITKRAGVPQITPISSNPKITRLGNPWIFRLQASDDQQAEAIVNYAVNVLKLKKMAIMYQSDDYGTGGKDVIVRRLKELGLEPVAVEAFNPDAKDMSAQILKIKNAGADGLFMWTMYAQGALIARQSRQLGLKVPLMGGGGLTNPKLVELAGEAAYGLLNTQTFFPDPEGASPEAKAFIEAYKKEYGILPDSNAAMSYDSMMILAEAMKKAGPALNKKEVRDNIAATKNYRGVTGVITIDKYGDANRDILIIRVKEGGGYEVVWPKH